MKQLPFNLRYAAFDRVAGLPALEPLGFTKLETYGASKAFADNPTPPPKLSKNIRIPGFMDFLLDRFSAGYTGDSVIDIEHVGTRYGHPQVQENVQILHQVIDIHDAALPNAKFGMYGAAAVAHLNHTQAADPVYMAARQAHFEQWVTPLLDRMDYVVVQAYTLDDQHDTRWAPVVRANVATAKAITNNPVMVWLKPRYNIHVAAFANDPIPYAQWLAQLNELKGILAPTDHVVFWEGAVSTFSEFDSQNWYKATVDFVEAQPDAESPPPPPTPPTPPAGLNAVIEADTYTSELAPTSNFGSSDELRLLASKYIGYVRVNVSGVPPQGVQAARLVLKMFDSTGGLISIKHLSGAGAWDEASLTHEQRPPGTLSGILASALGNTADIVLAGLESVVTGDGLYTFVLESDHVSNVCGVTSREHVNPPEFLVTPNPEPPPAPPTCEQDLATVRQDLEDALSEVDALVGLVQECLTRLSGLEAELEALDAKLLQASVLVGQLQSVLAA